MKIESWPIDKPTPYARNPRKISQRAVDKVAASLAEYGFRQPIVVDRKGIVVIGRWQEFTGKEATLESNGKTFSENSKAREAA